MQKTVNYKLGHRSRVKDRFLREGIDTFADYEILELLLFFIIPRRDTKDMAHALMHTFLTLDGVLSASEEELCRVSGIGPRVAAFLRSLLPFADYILKKEKRPTSYRDTEKLGVFFRDFFYKHRDLSAAVLLLSNSKEPLRIVPFPEVQSFEAFVNHVPRLISEAYSVNAPVIVLATNKNEGIPFPSYTANEVFRDLENELAKAGILLYETVFVVGSQYTLFLRQLNGTLCHTNAEDPPHSKDTALLFGENNAETEQRLLSFLSLSQGKEAAERETKKLLSVYPSLATLSAVPYDTLTERDGVAPTPAMLLKLVSATYARAKISGALASSHSYQTTDDIGRLFCDVLGARTTETMALAMFDEERRLLGIRLFGEGTVNTTVFAYRSLLEEAMKRHASFVALAHNHPLGFTAPSSQDYSTTSEAERVFRGVNIGFLDHFVVTEREYYAISRRTDGFRASSLVERFE